VSASPPREHMIRLKKECTTTGTLFRTSLCSVYQPVEYYLAPNLRVQCSERIGNSQGDIERSSCSRHTSARLQQGIHLEKYQRCCQPRGRYLRATLECNSEIWSIRRNLHNYVSSHHVDPRFGFATVSGFCPYTFTLCL